MNNLERRALLGDRQAQEECTRRGIVLACPFCGGSDGKALFKFVHSDLYAHKRTGRCALDGMIIHNVADWNTRPAPPIGRCKDCSNWRGEPGDEYAPCSDCDGLMEADNFCGNFEPKQKELATLQPLDGVGTKEGEKKNHVPGTAPKRSNRNE